MPEFRCPVPCSYDQQLWRYLFVASALVNAALLLVVVPFIVRTERRDKLLYAKHMGNGAAIVGSGGGNNNNNATTKLHKDQEPSEALKKARQQVDSEKDRNWFV